MIVRADARAIPLADESVQCVVTSPPYWSLRDYQTAGQIGLEKSIVEYIGALVGVFEEVRRVLHASGVCFVNIGDSYAAARGYQVPDTKWHDVGNSKASKVPDGLKAKDLCLIPERLAIALQEAGWWVRSRIAWVKPAPMPESVGDRPTSAWEHLWLLAKSPTYYWDAEAVREPMTTSPEAIIARVEAARKARIDKRVPGDVAKIDRFAATTEAYVNPNGRNLRNWWQIGPDPSSAAYCVACDLMYERTPYVPRENPGGFRQGSSVYLNQTSGHDNVTGNSREPRCVRCKGKLTAHYAAYPRELVRRCVLAGSPEKGVCAACRLPWVREIAGATGGAIGKSWHDHSADGLTGNFKVKSSNGYQRGQTLGWKPQCKCGAPTRPALVLDPFSGTGTTLLVARDLGRRAVGLELSWEYCRYAQRRLSQMGLFGHDRLGANFRGL